MNLGHKLSFLGPVFGLISVSCQEVTVPPPSMETPSETPETPEAGETAMVIGLLSDDMDIILERLHITTSIDGMQVTDETLDNLEHGETFGPPPWYPKEIRLTPGAARKDAEVAVQIEGYLNSNLAPETEFPGVDLWPGVAPDDPDFARKRLLFRRLARKRFIPGETSLLRITLENKCSRIIFGPYLEGPICNAPETCIGGACLPDDSDALVPYARDWATSAPDTCKPANGGPPQVLVGSGQAAFAPLTDGQTLTLEEGPQGGHHLWISLRVKGLKQAGSITTITAVQPGTNLAAPKAKFAMAFSEETGGFCKLYGLRYQLDAGGDLAPFLGKPLDLQVEVAEPGGLSASAAAHIIIDAVTN
jgi:hypothetical protein